jgi:hypothetical protein
MPATPMKAYGVLASILNTTSRITLITAVNKSDTIDAFFSPHRTVDVRTFICLSS